MRSGFSGEAVRTIAGRARADSRAAASMLRLTACGTTWIFDRATP
jgi:hypothetical protein